MNIILKFFCLFIFTLTNLESIAQKIDCKKDTNCIKMVLMKKINGWKYIETKSGNWKDSKKSSFYFVFQSNKILNIFKLKENQRKLIFSTNYQIINSYYNQPAIRIFNFDNNFELILYGTNIQTIKPFVDFKFFYNDKGKLILRYDEGTKIDGWQQNFFE